MDRISVVYIMIYTVDNVIFSPSINLLFNLVNFIILLEHAAHLITYC